LSSTKFAKDLGITLIFSRKKMVAFKYASIE